MTIRIPPSSPSGFVAFGDESASRRRLDPDVYLLAAVVLDPGRVAEVREQANELLLLGQVKAHWRNDTDDRHDTVIESVAAMAIKSIVVVREGPPDERAERRRRKCLERFIHELEQNGCEHLTLESRGRADDRNDRTLLDTMRARKLSSLLRLDHKPGPADPLLWLPDAICGAVVAARTGEPRWLDALENCVQIIEINDRPQV